MQKGRSTASEANPLEFPKQGLPTVYFNLTDPYLKNVCPTCWQPDSNVNIRCTLLYQQIM